MSRISKASRFREGHLVEGGQRPLAKRVQITATDPKLGSDLRERDPAEEG
jgi:hypothetical protein